MATIEDLERRSASLPDREERMRAFCNLSSLEACMGREEHYKWEGEAQKIAESILKECEVARSTPGWIPRYERLFGFVAHCGSIQPWGVNHRGVVLRSLLTLYAKHCPLMTGKQVLDRLEASKSLESFGEINLSGSLVPESWCSLQAQELGEVEIYGQNYVFGQVGGRFHWIQFGSGCFTHLLATYTVTGTARVVGVFRSEDGASKARSTTFQVIGLLHGALAVLFTGPRTGWTGETKIAMLGDPPVEVVISEVEVRPGSRTAARCRMSRFSIRMMPEPTTKG